MAKGLLERQKLTNEKVRAVKELTTKKGPVYYKLVLRESVMVKGLEAVLSSSSIVA